MRVFTSLAGLTLAISTSLGITPSLPTSQVSQTSEETTVTKPVRSFAKIADNVLHAHGKIQAFVRINKLSGLEQKEQTLQSLRRGRSGLSQLAQQQIASAKAEEAAQASLSSVDSVLAELQKLDPQARLLFKTKYNLAGFAVSADAKALSTLASRSGDVLRVSPLPVHESTAISTKKITKRYSQLQNTGSATPSNYNSDGLVNAVQTWEETGQTGKDVNIAVVDTGLDYTHADFGGSGTEEAYKTAYRNQDVDPLKDPVLSKLLDKNKFKGGYDFAGADYGNKGNTQADPDPNPIDGSGGHHGTHVAGTAVGYGVQADHTTYRGDYSHLTPEEIAKWEVGPGTAPEAGIYSLKVFGDLGGSTNLVLEALDWVTEHNLKATEKNRISIVSMSLGGSFGAPDDPENVAINNLAKDGVLSVIAAGNDGDISDVLGAPATASSSLTVAASQSGKTIQDAITVNEGPASLKGHQLAGQYSSEFEHKSDFTLTAKVVRVKDPENLEGCKAYSQTDAAAVKGNIAYIKWNDAQITCGSAQRFKMAAKAGAVGVLFGSIHNIPEAGIAGNKSIPGFQLVKRATDNAELQQAIDAGTLKVTLSSAQSGVLNADYSDNYQDTIASFTSRGLHGSFDGTVKPDVAAPGVGIISASAGTGYKHEVMSGTSMATPLVAGVAALVKSFWTDFTPQQIKSQIINTAAHDVTSEDRTQVYSPLRVGTGRVDAYAAVTNYVRVFADDNPEAVTAQFGVVQVPAEGYSAKKTFRVVSSAPTDRTFAIKYLPRTQTPGVNYTLSTNTITVKRGSTATFNITLSIPDQSALRHTRDLTQKPEAVKGFERQYVTDASGVVELTPQNEKKNTSSAKSINEFSRNNYTAITQGAVPLRVAVSCAPKPFSDTQAVYDRAKSILNIQGHGVNQGGDADGYKGKVTPLILAGDDSVDGYYGDPAKNATRSLASADIRAFGYSSTAPQLEDPSKGIVNFGVTTDKYWNHLGNSLIPSVFILASDSKDGAPRIYETSISTRSDKNQMTDRSEIKTYQIDSLSRKRVLKDTQVLDNASVYDSNSFVFPVKLSALGFTKNQEHAYITYEIRMDSPFAEANDFEADTAGDADDPANRFDAYHPDVWFGTKQATADAASTAARSEASDPKSSDENGVSSFADVESTVIPVHIAEDYKGDKLQTLSIHSLAYAPNAGDKYTADIDNITPVKKDALQDSVDRYQKLDKSSYTPETWKTFETALTKAKQVLADPSASQEDVDAAYNNLQEAYNGLVKAAPPVNKDKLSAEVTADKTLKQSDYTPATWEAFDKALKDAQSVLDNSKTTQEEVNTALDKLTKARESLAKKEAPSKPSEPGKSNLENPVSPAQPTTPGKSESGSPSTPGSNKPGSQGQQPGNSESKKNDPGSANKQVLTKATKTKLSQTGTSITILTWTLMTAVGLSITAITAKRKASKQRS